MTYLATIWEYAQPSFIYLMSSVLAFIIARAANEFRRRTGLEIEEKHRKALHEALMSGLRAALRENPKAALDVLKDRAVAHAKQSVPDAIAYLNTATEETMKNIAARYAQDIGQVTILEMDK